MAAHAPALASVGGSDLRLTYVATERNLRVLCWSGTTLYGSRGYHLLRSRTTANNFGWEHVAEFGPAWWRKLTSQDRLASRLCRDGFHALAVLSTRHIVAATPGAIVTLAPGDRQFRITHQVLRGTRPLHFAVTPDDVIYWGEYFDNPNRDEVHIYASRDRGATWDIAYTFPKRSIRHVHNIVYDRWENRLWVLTGDEDHESRILRASCDFRHVETILEGSQQARAVALVPTTHGLYLSSDTPLEKNYVYRMDRNGSVAPVTELSASSINGCQAGDSVFFSTMVEPSASNKSREVELVGSADGVHWQRLGAWIKDSWPMHLFQYGNAFLPDGLNLTPYLAATTLAVRDADCQTTIWRMEP